MRTKLEPAQIDAAYRLFYGEGKNLGAIAADLGCGIYDLSPWLTASALKIAREAREEPYERINSLYAEIKCLEGERNAAYERIISLEKRIDEMMRL